MDCPKCGFVMSDLDVDCPRCKRLGENAKTVGNVAKTQAAATPPPPPVAPTYRVSAPASALEDVATSIIPTRNPAALWSYYIGLFSLFPGLGPLMGIFAVVMGIKALKVAAVNPELKGRVHAVVGIIAGVFFGGISVLFTVFVIKTLSA